MEKCRTRPVLKQELAFCFVLGLVFMLVALISSRLTRGYLRIRYDQGFK
jgi:hypothetical protein